jgi:hypothetical protein
VIITSANLNISTAHRSNTKEDAIMENSKQEHERAEGKNINLTQRENVSLQASQSNQLYSRSELYRVGQENIASVQTQEQVLQSLVSFAFSRELQVRNMVPLETSAAAATTSPIGQPLGLQSSTRLSSIHRLQIDEKTVTTFEGTLQLADQRSISFVMQIRMDSTFLFQSASGQFSQDIIQTDPLILNLHGGAAQLTNTAFAFDLDADGRSEQVSFATGGSGFIAFDRNGDGKINDGSELFGAVSGDGFADLAAYDEDHNGFIDSNDKIYTKLGFLSVNEHGHQSLRQLNEVGVAAIGLQRADSPFALRGNAGQELGRVRSTGFFVTETGTIGTVQQVDLTKRNMSQEAAFATNFDQPQRIVAQEENSSSNMKSELDIRIERLQAIHARFMSEIDASRGRSEDSTKIRTTLEMLVDGLKEQLRRMRELRERQ